MNYRTDIVIFLWGGGGGAYWGGAVIREEHLFRKSYFLEGRLSESGRSLDHLR